MLDRCIRLFRIAKDCCLVRAYGILALAPDPRPVLVENIRHWRQKRAQTRHDRQRVVHTHVLVERRRDDRHPTRSDISNQRDRRQGTSCVQLVGVDDVLVAARCDQSNGIEAMGSRH